MSASDLLPAATRMGAVTLEVADLDRMIRYYSDGVRLDLLAQEGGRAVLGRGAVPIVILEHAPGLRHAAPGSAGLFHTAILFETKADLAAALHSIAVHYPGTFTGSADHLVSLAFYMTDPEGNGVELYWDRDRTEWSWVHGRVGMDTLYLDPNAFLHEHLTEDASEAALERPGRVGHVHLSVGDVETAKAFYVDRLGFAVTTSLAHSALFVSAGGYHHHMAMNVWQSRGAGRRAPALGLGQVHIELPTADDLGATAERLRDRGVPTEDDGRSVALDDPWGNRIQLSTESGPEGAVAE
jgi:catechol 2,3-dioxygenase